MKYKLIVKGASIDYTMGKKGFPTYTQTYNTNWDVSFVTIDSDNYIDSINIPDELNLWLCETYDGNHSITGTLLFWNYILEES
jgi:hypothetical protein